mmetsp:Transcript_7595/g.24300  ORF Transcript_7595/g.24300 Transcript_7595/m.24300 type:complete len:214 (+) Transcript_7595:343-984(+)
MHRISAYADVRRPGGRQELLEPSCELRVEGGREVDREGDDQVSELGRDAVLGHPLALDPDALPRLGHAAPLDGNRVAVEVREGGLEAEQRRAERDRHLHRERLSAALEELVRHRLQLEDDVAGDLAGLLLGLVLEGDLLRVGHPLFYRRLERLLLALALLLRLNHHLLLHNHARPRPPVDHLLLLRASAAPLTARHVRLLFAVSADDPPLDGG